MSENKLPEINIAPQNGCLEDDPFLLGIGQFSGAFLLLDVRFVDMMQ